MENTKPTLADFVKSVRRHSVHLIMELDTVVSSIPATSPLHADAARSLNAFRHAEGIFEGVHWQKLPTRGE